MKLLTSLSRRGSGDLGSTGGSVKSSTSNKKGLFSFASSPPSEAQQLRRELEELKTQARHQAAELENLREALAREEGEAADWREQWNFQNFKLQLLIDMWVLREIELENSEPSEEADSDVPSLPSREGSVHEGEKSPATLHKSVSITSVDSNLESASPKGWTRTSLDAPRSALKKGDNDDLVVESSIGEDEF